MKAINQFKKTNDDIIIEDITGSGKTLAYLLPILNNIDINKNQLQAIIMTPTRELATQIKLVYESLKIKKINYILACGKINITLLEKLHDNIPQLLIGDSQCLYDLFFNQDYISYMYSTNPNQLLSLDHITLKYLKYMVFDEADYILTQKDGTFLLSFLEARKRIRNKSMIQVQKTEEEEAEGGEEEEPAVVETQQKAEKEGERREEEKNQNQQK